jgi:hypothetical protein
MTESEKRDLRANRMTDEVRIFAETLRNRGFNDLLVIHVNIYTQKTDGGYLLDLITLKRCGNYMTTSEVGKHIMEHPETPINVLYT